MKNSSKKALNFRLPIKELLIQKGYKNLTDQALENLGMSKKRFYMVSTGRRNPTAMELFMLSKFLEVPMERFFEPVHEIQIDKAAIVQSINSSL